MTTCYTYDTAFGTFHIISVESQWVTMHNGESLGKYPNPDTAAVQLSSGRVPMLHDGTSAADLCIAADLQKWSRAHANIRVAA